MNTPNDLQVELEEALDDDNFSFSGSFFHAGLLSSSPNPYLNITGLGIVGLPLSDRDAKAIIPCATLAPFGKGERTVVDKEVRDTWEIEPAKISFANPQWDRYVKDVVCVEVCKSLGVNLVHARPRMELYKMLLYEKGSHFLPHQDTQKANGMFATVIIVLPSAYTGGQVILSHSSKRQTIDFSKDSFLSTALLAWYTDVKHEVKEVTSGYRLALSYNLIHDASLGVPCPALPDVSNSVVELRRVLEKWRDGKYDERSGSRVVACLLEHQYSPFNLKVGIKALKGSDAHKLSLIQPLAEDLGFMVGIANLSHYVAGPADDCGGYHDGRRRRYDYDYDEETPDMIEIDSRITSIEGLVNSDGSPLIPIGKVALDDDCLIPRDPFEDESPDEQGYEGYMGNWAGQVEHWYRRTVFVLMQKSKVDETCYKAGGVAYAHIRLTKSSTIPPTDEDRLWATRLLQNTTTLNQIYVLTLMDYALKWQDLNLWKGAMKCSASTLKNIDKALLLKAWKIFSFEAVCLSFEELLARSTDLQERMHFIYSLPSQGTSHDLQKVEIWCQKESDKILSSYNPVNVLDIPLIISIIRAAGPKAIAQTVVPNLLKKPGTYAFLLALRKALVDGRQDILDAQAKRQLTSPSSKEAPKITDVDAVPTSPRGQGGSELNSTAILLEKLIKLCLDTAATQWSDVHEQGPYSYPSYGHRISTLPPGPQNGKITRIVEIMEHAIISADMDVIKRLFVDVLKVPGETATKFIQIYTPLIPRLKGSLAKNNIDLNTPPFVSLLQILIGLYLRDVLGQKNYMSTAGLRKIGCGCMDCQPLDVFIMDPTTTTTTFRLVQKRRLHVEQQVASASDLCTFTTIRSGSPHGVQVTKRPAVVAAATWGHRQRAAQAFLGSIGANAILAQIMGARYPEVGMALLGTRHFGSVQAEIEDLEKSSRVQAATTPSVGLSDASHGVTSAAPQVSTAATSSTLPATNTAPRMAGTKRKSLPAGIQLGPVIDLTSP